MTVGQRFDSFLEKLKLTDVQIADGKTAHHGVRKVLNQHYWGSTSETANSLLAGSWGKNTATRPPRDVDVLFNLPPSVYWTYQARTGNRQSQLLQEVKGVLAKSYSRTRMRGDGQVVVVDFAAIQVEVVPAFIQPSGQYWICDTNGGGSYKNIDPVAEVKQIQDSNTATAGNTRALARMMKRWQRHCDVPLKSFMLEITGVGFLSQWEHRGKSSTWYDWMVRDYLEHLVKQANTFIFIPGTYTLVWLGDGWKSKAETALGRAKKACDFEYAKDGVAAGSEWQKIFGCDIPSG